MRGSMKTRNWFASVLLSGVLAFSLCPISAYAVEASDGPDRDNASRLEQTPPSEVLAEGPEEESASTEHMPSGPSAPSRSTEAPLTHRAADTALASATGTAAAAPMPQSPSPAANSTQRHRMPAPIGCRWKPRPRNCTHPPKRRRGGARRHDRRHGTGAAAVAALGCAALAGAAMTAAIRARRRIR